MTRKQRRNCVLVLAAFASLEQVATTRASTWTGNGPDNNFQTASNWDIVPTAGAALTFNGANRLTPNNDFAADTSFSGITFAPTASPFTIGGNRILLGGDINHNAANAQAITLGLDLDGATSNVNVTAGGTLSLGPITMGLANQSLNVSTLNVNNSVSVAGLTVQTNTPAANAINIASGATLNLTGAVQIGSKPTAAPANTTVLNLTGAGTLNVSNGGNFNVQTSSGNNSFGNGSTNVVDMTGLSNFNFSSTSGTFSLGWIVTRPNATVRLANTSNTITAALLGIANSGAGNGADNAGTGGNLFLGAGSNVLHVNAIDIGWGKATGNMQFQSAASGSVVITGTAGGASTTDIVIGNANIAASYGGNGQDSIQLAGHNATVQAGTVTVGQLAGATGGTALTSTLTFDTGTFSANTMQLALDGSGTAATGVTSVFTMGGSTAGNITATGILNVNNNFYLANRTNASGGVAKGTFTLNGGTANVNCDISDPSTAGTRNTTLTVDGGTLNLAGHNIGSDASPITTVTLNSGTVTNVARVSASTINIGASMNLSASTTYVVAAGGTLTSSKTPLTLGSSGGIGGGSTASQSTVSGDVEAASGSRVTPGVGLTAGTLRFNNNLSLDSGSTVRFKLSNDPNNGNDRVSVGGNLTAAGTVNVEIGSVGSGAQIGNTYTLMDYSGSLTGNETNFSIAGFGSRQTFTIVPTATTPGTVQLSVGGTAAFNLTWIGNSSSTWNLQGASNWQDPTPSSQQFFNADNVTFDDTSTNASDVNIVGQLLPGSVTVNANRNYKFVGTGGISGGTGLTKSGTGTLTVAQTNSYTGLTDIQVGTLQVGDGGSSGTLGNSTVNVGSVLAFNRSDSFTFANPITGGGTIQKLGNGTVTLPSANTFTGQTLINAGTIRVANFGALGTGSAAITIASGGQLDIGGLTGQDIANGFGAHQFSIAGAGPDGSGALVNNGGPEQFNAFQQVTLTGNATVGGTGRLDMRNAAPQLDLAGFTLTKAGSNVFGLVGVNVTDGNIVVNNGTLAIETSTSIPDNATGKSITYNAGPGVTTTAWFYNFTGNVTRPMFFNSTGGGTILIGVASPSPQNSTVGSNMTFSGPVTLTALNNATAALILNGNVTGDATSTVTKSGAVTVSFSGNVNYGGPTNLAAGTLAFNGSGSSTIGNVDGVGTATLMKQNSGNLTVNYARVGNLNISGGQMIVAPNAGPSGVSVVGALALSGARLDITNNKLIEKSTGVGTWNGANYDGLTGLVQSGRNAGAWDGQGIVTSQTPATTSHFTSLGIARASDVRPATATATGLWGGQTITGTDTLIMYTYGGDATLDGKINVDDYIRIDSGIAAGLTGWSNGDFNYDGKINIDDYTQFIDANIGTQGAAFPTAGGSAGGSAGVSAVPEPAATLSIMGLAAAGMLRRQRRRGGLRR